MYTEMNEMLGKTLKSVVQTGNDRITFEAETGERYIMEHHQDCCESVYITDVTGDLQDLVGAPLVEAEESRGDAGSHGWPGKGDGNDYEPESCTWTFYRFGTRKGSVVVRWFGSSNGYYGESASIYKA